MRTTSLDRESVLAVLEYLPASGTFTRRDTGKLAGATNARGYRQLAIAGVIYYVHRLVWLVETGSFPGGVLDHVNRDKGDNRFSNLRVVSHKQNMENTGMYAHNTSGYKGVFWDSSYGKWQARVTHNGKQYFAGRFDSVYDAHQAYRRKVAQLFTCQ